MRHNYHYAGCTCDLSQRKRHSISYPSGTRPSLIVKDIYASLKRYILNDKWNLIKIQGFRTSNPQQRNTTWFSQCFMRRCAVDCIELQQSLLNSDILCCLEYLTAHGSGVAKVVKNAATNRVAPVLCSSVPAQCHSNFYNLRKKLVQSWNCVAYFFHDCLNPGTLPELLFNTFLRVLCTAMWLTTGFPTAINVVHREVEQREVKEVIQWSTNKLQTYYWINW